MWKAVPWWSPPPGVGLMFSRSRTSGAHGTVGCPNTSVSRNRERAGPDALAGEHDVTLGLRVGSQTATAAAGRELGQGRSTPPGR